MKCLNLHAVLGVVFSLMLVELINSQSDEVYNSWRRLPSAAAGKHKFRLLAAPPTHSLRYGGRFGSSRRHRPQGAVGKPGRQRSALKAGSEGSYDFKDQFNAINPDKKFVKPTKAPVPVTTTTVNPNKINIESRIAAVTESQAMIEKATLGGTAILHCYFDDSVQIGEYRHSQIWWTKQPQRSKERPVILGAGTQIRIPDDRLKLVNFPDESYSILIIRKVLASDAGDYKCSLPTVSGTKMEFTSLMVYDPAEESIVTSAENNVVEVGDDLTLSCKPNNPKLNVWWTAEHTTGEIMQIVSGKNKVPTKKLKLNSVTKNRAGIYTCHVQVRVGSPVRKQFTVQVKERPWAITAFNGGFNVDTFLAKFSKDPEYGDEVNLRCDSGGIPIPTITWLKDGTELIDGDKHKIKSYEPTYKEHAVISGLTVINFSPKDEGRYQCVASNDVDVRQREFTLKGYYNSAIERRPSSSLTTAADDEEDIEETIPSSPGLVFGNRVLGEGSGEEQPGS